MARQQRTFGWVQNPNKLTTLKYITGIFLHNSYSNKDVKERKLKLLKTYNFISNENYKLFKEELNKKTIIINFDILVGKGNSDRKAAICTGIVQASIDAHSSSREVINEYGQKIKIKKPFTDDWTANGYVRWAVSTGLLTYDKDNDTCKISELGIALVNSKDNSEEEKEIFTKALLSNPPVCRVLEILENQELYTKFEIGKQLGFKGEMGFSSIKQESFIYDFCTETNPNKRNDIRSNTEGDADKYARTICNWLVQMGWLKKTKKKISGTYLGLYNEIKHIAWQITRDGEKALARSKGYSSNAKIPKIVKYEMLGTKIPNIDYIRKRRAHIIEALNTNRSILDIIKYLAKQDLEETAETIKDDIKNLKNIGINVIKNQDYYRITDKIIDLEIPKERVMKDDVDKLKERIRERLISLDHEYLVLVDLAYSDASTKKDKNKDAREFEIQTARLFTEELDFKGYRLGDSNRPDVIIYNDNYGTIIDNKSYKDGFNIPASSRDEISRYIEENQNRLPGVPSNEWWKNFDQNVNIFTFLFITSYLKGNFKDAIKYIHDVKNIDGGAISVEQLLYVAEDLKNGKLLYNDFFKLINNNEIIYQ